MTDGAVHPSLARHVPSYASKPSARSAGATLVTLKDGRGIGSVALDTKSCYSLGRNADVADVAVEHALASRAHCLLAWDQEGRLHLVDLDSTHGEALAAGGRPLAPAAATPTQNTPAPRAACCRHTARRAAPGGAWAGEGRGAEARAAL
jgi:hypothetical protein